VATAAVHLEQALAGFDIFERRVGILGILRRQITNQADQQ
jgi:hypothetical protein